LVKEKIMKGSYSYIGPLGSAEESADKFVSGIIYSNLIEKILFQQQVVNALLKSDLSEEERMEALETDKALEKVWLSLGEEFGMEC